MERGKYRKLIDKERELVRQLQAVREQMKLLQNSKLKKPTQK